MRGYQVVVKFGILNRFIELDHLKLYYMNRVVHSIAVQSLDFIRPPENLGGRGKGQPQVY